MIEGTKTLNNYKSSKKRGNMATLTVKVSKTMEGFVGQCTQNPQFIVSTKKKAEIPDKIKTAISGYVDTFPEEKKNVLPKGSMDFQIKMI